MTSPVRMTVLPAFLASALFAAGLFAPAPAAADDGGRAVAACRAEMLAHFPQDSIRNYRIGEISGSSRRTKVSIYVTADRRYTFECSADRDGRVVTAAFDPPRSDAPQLAAGEH